MAKKRDVLGEALAAAESGKRVDLEDFGKEFSQQLQEQNKAIKEQKTEISRTPLNSGSERVQQWKDATNISRNVAQAKKDLDKAEKDYQDYLMSADAKKKQDAYVREKQMQIPLTSAAIGQEPYVFVDETEQKLRQERDRAESAMNSARDQATMAADLEEINAMSEEERSALQTYANELNNTSSSRLSGGNLLGDIFGSFKMDKAEKVLREKYDRKRIQELAETLTWMQSEEATRAANEKGTRQGGGSVLDKAVGTAQSFGTNLAGAITAPAGYAVELMNRSGRYSTLNPNNYGNIPNVYSGAVRGQVTQDIRGDGSSKVRNAAAYLYQGGTSAIDNLIRVAVAGPYSLGLAATGSFGQTLSEASANGASPEQAVLMATANGGLEVLTEKIPLDELFKTMHGGKQTAKQIVLGAFKQAGLEATSEEINYVAQTLAEAAILRDKSDYNQRIGDLVANGMDYDSAKAQADAEAAQEAWDTAVISGISGGFAKVGASIQANVSAAGQLNTQQSKTTQQPPGTTTGTAIQQIQEAAQQVQAQPQEGQIQQDNTQGNFLETLADGIPAPQTEQRAKTEAEIQVEQAAEERGLRYRASKVNSAILDMVDRVKRGLTKGSEKVQLGTVSDANAAQIQRETGIDVHGYHVAIEARQIDHILKDHGENGASNQTMADPADIARMEYTLQFPDSIQKAGRTSAYVTNVNGRQRRADTVLYAKDIGNNNYYVVQAVPETKNKTLYVVSAFIGGKEYTNEIGARNGTAGSRRLPSQAPISEDTHSTNAIGPGVTSETEDTISSKNSIYQDGAEVNGGVSENPGYPQPGDTSGMSTEEGQSFHPTKSVGAAGQNFSGKAAYQDLLYEGNVQRDRAGDVRPMEVPKTDSYGRKVSEFVGNAYGAEITPDRMANQIETLVQEGALGFDSRSNREGMTQAADYIQQKGMAATRNEITRSIANGRIKDGDIEKAMLLYAEYSSRKSQGAMDNASEIMVDLATMANMSGRNLQLFKLVRKMTPEGQLMTEQKRIQRWVDSLNQKRGEKDQVKVTIPSELESEYLQAAKEAASAKTEDAKQKAQKKQAQTADAMNKVAASQVKATMKEKWDAWRYMAMLGNPLTQVRNVVGNTGFVPYKEAKDKIGAVIEKAIPKQMRTKSLVQDRDLLAWAREDAKTEQVQNALKYSSRLGDDVQKQKLEENRTIFETKALENVRKFVEQVPQAGDMLFKNPYYSRSLAGFLKARGYTAAEVQSGKVSDAVLSEARGYAIQEAMKATFNDSNSFSDFVSGLRYKGENPVGKAANIIAEGVLPFRRTPANIAVRFKEYSPIELARGLWDVAAEVNSGKVSAATAIDRVSSGLTGTAAMAFGYALANGMFGVKITGSGSDDDEQRQGRQDYALEFSIGGKEYSYTIDWAAPANLPLFVGANIYDGLKDIAENPDTSVFVKILQATGTMFEPMLELSCLSSLNDLVEGLRYAQEGEAIYTLASDIATSYLKQGIPSLFRQVYKISQDKTQTTFANSADPTIRDFQRTVAGLPFVGAAYQTDKVNAWGQTEETGGWIERAAKTFVSPGTLKKIDTGKLETEISRLNEVQEENVSPAAFDKVLSWTDKDGNLHKDQRLTEEQYQTLATTQGQTQARILNSLIESKDYNAMTDSQKAEAFKLVYQYAKEQGEAAAIGPERTRKAESWMMNLREGSEADAIVRKVTADTLDQAMSAMTSAWANGYNTEGNETQLEDAYKSYANLSEPAKEVVQDQVGSSASNYLEAREQGISQDDFLSVTKNIADLKPEGDGSNPTQNQKVEAIAYDDSLSEREKEVMLRLYVTDAQKENIDELKELGYGMEDYANLYRLVTDFTKGDGKKDRTSAEIARQYNISISAAEQLYDVFK